MNLSQVITAMKAAGCSPEQIGATVLGLSEAPQKSSNAERQARYRERQKAKVDTETVTSNVTDNVTSDATVTVTSNAEPVTPRVGERARVLCGEEVSILPLENATHSIPNGESVTPSRKPKSRATRLTADFVPTSSMRNYAKRHGFSEAEIDTEGRRMRDWSLANAAAVKLDWEATWRGWIDRRGEHQPRAGPSPNGHTQRGNSYLQALTDVASEIHDEPDYHSPSLPFASRS